MPSSRNVRKRKSSTPRKSRRKATRKRKGRKPLIIGLVLITVMALGFVLLYGGQVPINPTSPNIVEVVVTIPQGAGDNPKLGFEPAVMVIVIGINNTVVWKNEDSDWHTAHSNIPEFYSGIIQPGASFTHTFERPGIYPYHCDPHPWMTGLITVEAPSSSSAGGFSFSAWRIITFNCPVICPTSKVYFNES
jgi:plastocyanin